MNDMKTRRVEDGDGQVKVLVHNVLQKSWEEMPRNLALYMLGFPCTPWSMPLVRNMFKYLSLENEISMDCDLDLCCVLQAMGVKTRRGQGKGWKDPNAAPFFVGVHTIKQTEPFVFGLECVSWQNGPLV